MCITFVFVFLIAFLELHEFSQGDMKVQALWPKINCPGPSATPGGFEKTIKLIVKAWSRMSHRAKQEQSL